MTPASPTPPMPVGDLVDRYGKQRAIAPRLSGDQLARQCDFLEVAYIMLNGDAPDEASYQTFRETITRHTLVHEQ
ncbi:citrate synthase I [Klebsiella pneumoniae]|nr:citrate synthase I [Klebsiella pneumoniae]